MFGYSGAADCDHVTCLIFNNGGLFIWKKKFYMCKLNVGMSTSFTATNWNIVESGVKHHNPSTSFIGGR